MVRPIQARASLCRSRIVFSSSSMTAAPRSFRSIATICGFNALLRLALMPVTLLPAKVYPVTEV